MRKEYKLVVVGDMGVGKSSITVMFVQNAFLDEYDPTYEDTFRKQVTIDDEECLLHILDTAGQEEYASMRDGYIRSAEAFMFVYSITSRKSLTVLSEWRDQILQVKDVDFVPMLLVGNKCDLETAREVNLEEGERIANSFRCNFMETSAKTNLNIREAFFQLTRDLKKHYSDCLET